MYVFNSLCAVRYSTWNRVCGRCPFSHLLNIVIFSDAFQRYCAAEAVVLPSGISSKVFGGSSLLFSYLFYFEGCPLRCMKR